MMTGGWKPPKDILVGREVQRVRAELNPRLDIYTSLKPPPDFSVREGLSIRAMDRLAGYLAARSLQHQLGHQRSPAVHDTRR